MVLKTEVDLEIYWSEGSDKTFGKGCLWNEFGFVVESHAAKQSADILLLNI